VAREVTFVPEALTNLFELYYYIASASSAERARDYTDRIVATSRKLVTFPERGTSRDDLRPGLRTTTWRRRVVIAYHITAARVVIDRIFYGGRDLMAMLDERDSD
jgi:plasmid stabilization system protein ParE